MLGTAAQVCLLNGMGRQEMKSIQSHNPSAQLSSPVEELAALHNSTCWIPSVLATYAYNTIQYFVTSIAGMPMHVASTRLSSRIQLDAATTEYSQTCCSLEILFDHQTRQACVSLSFSP